MNRVLLAGFEGEKNPAKIITEQVKLPCRKVILPNDREKSAEVLRLSLSDKSVTCVVMLGQKPVIRNKIAVEPSAARNGHRLHTAMDCTVAKELLKAGGYNAYISKGAGNSYCNHIYYECLEMGVNCVFLHVPALDNISDTDKIIRAVEHFLSGIAGVPCAML
ncbi:MAG: hypothetical protein IJ385_01800 [Ruminiclostridium sp.]|nr:hypothetical protein [Ruminiclostridium sp.]